MTISTKKHNGSVGITTAAMVAFSSCTTPTLAMAPTEKSGKLFGMDFKCWQQKMFFYLTTLSLQRFISEDVPVLGEEIPENERFMNALEKKYKTEDAGLKKFVVAKFLDFKMVDGKSVITQVQELQIIVHDLLAEGMVINEVFQVATFIEKLPPLRKDFKNYLKHKRTDMKLKDLIVRLWIEEDNKAAEKKSRGNSIIMGANIIEEVSTSNRKRKKPFGPKNYPSKKKFKVIATTVESLVGNTKEWWIDSGATRHVCANKELFASHVPARPDETIFMGNSATTKIEGVGKIALKMTSSKVVTLNNVLHDPEIRKNLVSGRLLIKNGFKCVFVSEIVIISKNDVYVGKCYLTEGLSS
ncbi:uncharacterized protein LOC142165333 [Nicotiana tabacum]|uniref:Uncharacterized protein LOC142165333 n=1 Tax=Nicotiana tabacum TaxID=4097 RepID=A0AC58S4Y9_TOBAC